MVGTFDLEVQIFSLMSELETSTLTLKFECETLN